ncbi:MAG TPA: hypothetical protein VK808_03830 [Bacteroidia bacterium]|jgi:hypothetical protein|nr:hypothetical protein [Bacteroidia bacterium]
MRFIPKQVMLVAVCSLIAVPVFSQTTNTSTTKKVPPSGGTSLSADQSKMLCKAWKLDSVSAFGVDKKANSKEAGDGITPVADGSLFLTQEGVASTGKWTCGGGRLNAITSNAGTKSFKVISMTDARMVLEYQYPAPDYSKITYIYTPKK